MSDEIKACPFCGDPMKVVQWPGGLYAEHTERNKCWADKATVTVEDWNRRVEAPLT